MADLKKYFSGEKLYGDDFSEDEILSWFKDEEEGYANLGAANSSNYRYIYHQLNIRHGYSKLKERNFKHVLGLGSAYCDELSPIADRIEQITVLEPSSAFAETEQVQGVPCRFVKPHPSGNMSFETNTFDLISCLGVLHHIPNVSHVMSECHRVLAPGGIMILREPLVSMGDWSKPRTNLTARERGIPLQLMKDIVRNLGFIERYYAPCMFRPLSKICARLKISAFNSRTSTFLDSQLSRAFAWNMRYHRTTLWHRFAPTSMFLVLEKKK